MQIRGSLQREQSGVIGNCAGVKTCIGEAGVNGTKQQKKDVRHPFLLFCAHADADVFG